MRESNMSNQPPAPIPRLTVITLGVSDMRASIAFYEALGFARKFRATGEAVAFFDTGGTVLALFPWDQLAADATLPDQPRPKTFRGSTLAWNCSSVEEVDAVPVLADEARAIGRRALAVRCHVGDWDQCGALVDAAIPEAGKSGKNRK